MMGFVGWKLDDGFCWLETKLRDLLAGKYMAGFVAQKLDDGDLLAGIYITGLVGWKQNDWFCWLETR